MVGRRGGAARGGRRARPGHRHGRHPDAADVHPRGRRGGRRAARASCPTSAILLLSQAVETHFAAQLLERHAERFGYLLKDRVIDVPTLTDALQTIAARRHGAGPRDRPAPDARRLGRQTRWRR